MKFEKTGCCALLFMLIAMLGITQPCSAETSKDKISLEDVQHEAHDLILALKSYTVDQRDKAIKQTGTALDHLDKRIDALELSIDNNWDKMDKAAREKARVSLKALRKQRTQVAEWYGSLKMSSADVWEQVKKDFSDAYGALQEAWVKSEKEFGADQSGAKP